MVGWDGAPVFQRLVHVELVPELAQRDGQLRSGRSACRAAGQSFRQLLERRNNMPSHSLQPILRVFLAWHPQWLLPGFAAPTSRERFVFQSVDGVLGGRNQPGLARAEPVI